MCEVEGRKQGRIRRDAGGGGGGGGREGEELRGKKGARERKRE